MSDRIFLDSNILIYCYSASDNRKQNIARNLALAANNYISTQVINETANVLYKKYHIAWGDIDNLITDFENNFTVHTITSSDTKKACNIASRYGFSFF